MVEPLKSRTMTLSQLQMRTMDVLRKVKFQFRRPHYSEGISDAEFVEQIVDPLLEEIYQDRQVLKMARAARPKRQKKSKGAK